MFFMRSFSTAFCLSCVSATTALALPSESGRDWDTAANAVRYVTVTTPARPFVVAVEADLALDTPAEADVVPVLQIEPAQPSFAATSTRSVTPGDAMTALVEHDPSLILREGEGDTPDTMMMLAEVLFSFGQATIAPEAEESLNAIAQAIVDMPLVEVMGHTDAIGSDQNNVALAQARANAVRDWLITRGGVPAENIVARGIGENDPIADNFTAAGLDNPEGRALNRRVEFMFP